MSDSFNSKSVLSVNDKDHTIYKLGAVESRIPEAKRLPFSLKILLENLLRYEDGTNVTDEHISSLARWDAQAEPSLEIAYTPARVLLQDFTGVPAVVDLAAMRDAMNHLGGDPNKINPLQPAELVIDHSVQVDDFGTPEAMLNNAQHEFERNKERYQFLRWGQKAFANFAVVPPDTGIVHQVNLEYLARVVFVNDAGVAYPDTLVGTDSHTTMINGLGVLGWGVGGIEAEAAMLGQPVSMLIPKVVGFKLSGQLPEGATATDLVLTVTQILRSHGVVGKFVEFYGDGLSQLPLADRATIANMAPEYGATCGIFPVDAETLRYLRMSGRPEDLVRLVEAYYREQGMFREDGAPEAVYSDTLELNLSTIKPSLAGPKRPQDRLELGAVRDSFRAALPDLRKTEAKAPSSRNVIALETEGGGQTAVGATAAVEEQMEVPEVSAEGQIRAGLKDGSVVIAAITSCTNTSNPSVMLAAGLVAKNAVERGLTIKPWVKSSLAPGSKVVTEYLQKAGLLEYLEKLRFHVVGYGCTTCIGNSGPLPDIVSEEVEGRALVVASVLSGNRNFEGRVHPEVRANYLASPPLVVAYALAGSVDVDLQNEPVGTDSEGKPIFLRDIWPTQKQISEVTERSVLKEMFASVYAEVFTGDTNWNSLPVPEGDLYDWQDDSTYVKKPPFFEAMAHTPEAITDVIGARVLALLGDSITTDHISPAGSIKPSSPAGRYLQDKGVDPLNFNSYGSRRGNHEVMMRGTFANVRLRNLLAPGTEGGVTRHLPDGTEMSIYDASMQYQQDGIPLIVLAGKEYGSGSSRDWAAKGTRLLGVKAVIAESFERIHRSNLVGMGVLPLEFLDGNSAESLGLTGEETFDIHGLADAVERNFSGERRLQVKATAEDGSVKEFEVRARIDTPKEALYYRNGGILHYVLRQLAAS